MKKRVYIGAIVFAVLLLALGRLICSSAPDAESSSSRPAGWGGAPRKSSTTP